MLLDRGADISMVEKKYESAFRQALHSKDVGTTSQLLDQGVDVNMVGGAHGSLLATAVYRGDIDIMQLLLDRGADVNMVGAKYGTALTLAAYRGRMDAVSLLLDRGADVNIVGGSYGTALAAAAYGGRMNIMLLLLDRGADVNMEGEYGTALATATFAVDQCRAKMDVMLLLLDRGADVNIVADGCETALAIAAYGGKVDTVSLLLDRGADVNLVGGKYGTALVAAACGGRMNIIRLLLDQEANVNIVGGSYGTALVAAAYGGRMNIIRLLLDRGADVNMVGDEYGTALAAAAYGGEKDAMLLLLNQGADVTIVGGKYGTALAAAAYGGKINVIPLLLSRGADVNMLGDKYGTALAAAAYGAKVDTVSLLLDEGADVDMVGSEYGTALAAAAFQGKIDTAMLLLGRGASINEVGGQYGTALAAAAYGGKMDMIRLLLDQGAYVNRVGGEYGTALAAAAYGGGIDAVLLLLKKGADITVVGGGYWTALAAAASGGQMDIVSPLLAQGVDINTIGGQFGTALAAAAYAGKVDTVLLLLDRGADVNMVGGEYGTALAAAAYGGKMNTLQKLLDRGAHVNMVGGKYGTALGAAAYGGRMDALQQLVYRGANVNMMGGKFRTPLAAAVSSKRTDIASLLLEIGADVMSADGKTFVTPVDNKVFWPPFPMPYAGPYHHNSNSSSSSSSLILSAKFRAGCRLTSEQAGVPCPKLKEDILWNSLAALVGLHKGITLARNQWIGYDLCYFIAHHYDLGLAYAAARVAWKDFKEHPKCIDSNTVFTQRLQWKHNLRVLDKARLAALQIPQELAGKKKKKLQQELIISPYSIMPRRLWDLKSNRVVDFRMLHAAQPTIETPTFWAVTHSWTSDMSPVWTSINQYQWPVPLPKNIGLDYLRSELLNLGAEYIWLDVICLRQNSRVDDTIYDAATVDSLEQLRQQEWKIDVPTIGNIYRAAKRIVRYFNGLGIPFSNDGWDNPRHWLRRAWTLQEIAAENNTINGGIPRDRIVSVAEKRDRPRRRQVFLNSQGEVSEKIISQDGIPVPKKVIKFRSALRPVIQLAAQVDSDYGCAIYDLAREMAKRHAGNEVDKLSGLFYLLRTTKLPCYDEHKTSEDIWRESFHLLPLPRKAEILLDFPYRGSYEQWFPTWAQVLDWPTRDPEYEHIRFQVPQDLGGSSTPGGISLYIRNIWIIPDVIIRGTGYPGEYEVEINNEWLFGFYLPYLSQEPIDTQDPPVFTLAAITIGHAHNWMVCKTIKKKSVKQFGPVVAEVRILKKVSIMRTDSCSELLVEHNGVFLLEKVDCLFI